MSRIANPIAVRRFFVVDQPGREVVLTIGKPRPWRGDWACAVLVEGVPNERRRRVCGVDAIQALQIALEYARRTLDASGLSLTLFENGEPGDLGLPFAVPTAYGVAFQHRCEQYLERERLEMSSAVGAVLRERARRRAREAPKG